MSPSRSLLNRSLRPALTAAALASLLALGGCATSKDVRRASTNSAITVQHYSESARAPVVATTPDFTVSDGFYAAKTPLAVPLPNVRASLPNTFSRTAKISPTASMSLSDVAAYIGHVSGYQVSLADNLGASGGAAAPGSATLIGPGAIDLTNISYNGTLAGLLDYVTGQIGVSWRWTGVKIEIFKTETKMFRLAALSGDSSVSTNLTTSTSAGASSGGQASTGSGSTGGSGQSTKINSSFDLWKDVADTLKASLSPSGTMTVAQSSGLITVTDTPSALDRIANQVDEFNRVYGKQVMLDVAVYSVERSASENIGMDWTAAWSTAASKFGLKYATNNAGAAPSSSVPSLQGTITKGPWAGTSAIFNALNSLGHATLMTSGQVSTLNGQSVPMNVSREQAYLASSSTTLSSGVAGGASQTTLTPGVVVDGFSMHFTPKILENNDIMMRFSVDLSTTDAIVTFTSPDGTSAIQLPRRSVRDFLQTVSVHDNQSVVLAGFQQTNTNQSNQAPFSPNATILGGSRATTALTRTIVIVVTPHLIAPAD